MKVAGPTRLIVFSGLSGTGKSSIAKRLAEATGAFWLRIDSIEQAIRDAGVLRLDVENAGYLVAHALASDNLRLGQTVIADCVNDWALTRDAWRDVGLNAKAEVTEVEVVCSNAAEHLRRVETRSPDVPRLKPPGWNETMARDYHSWDRAHVVVDTAVLDLEACVEKIRAAIAT